MKVSMRRLLLLGITQLLIQKVKCQNLNYVFLRNKTSGEEALVKNGTNRVKCYNYSWLGPKNPSTSNADINIQCDEDFKEDEPCFEPIVYTIGEGKENGPNTTALEEKCLEEGTCNPLCEISGNEMCIKLVYYKSGEGDVESSHSFCGTINGVLPEDGCHYQRTKNGKDVQACFCNTDRCNSASRPETCLLIGLLLTFAFIFLK